MEYQYNEASIEVFLDFLQILLGELCLFQFWKTELDKGNRRDQGLLRRYERAVREVSAVKIMTDIGLEAPTTNGSL